MHLRPGHGLDTWRSGGPASILVVVVVVHLGIRIVGVFGLLFVVVVGVGVVRVHHPGLTLQSGFKRLRMRDP